MKLFKRFCALLLPLALILAAAPCGAADYEEMTCYLDILGITGGGVCQIEADNMGENDIECTIYLAVSGDDGIIKGVTSEKMSIAADDWAYADMKLPESAENGDVVTAFLWDGMTPLSEVLSQKVTSLIEGEVVYITGGYEDNGNYYINALAASNELFAVKLNEEVTLYDSLVQNMNAEEVYLGFIADCGGTVARIVTNSDGEISKLYLPECDALYTYEKYIADAENTYFYYSADEMTYGLYTINSDAVLFDLRGSTPAVYAAAEFLKDGRSYSFTAYGESEDAISSLTVTGEAEYPASSEPTRSDAEDSVMTVTKIALTLADDKDSYKITGIKDGSSTSIIVNPDSAADMAVSEAIAAGNVIVYEKNGSYAENIAVLFNATKTSLGEVSGDGGSISDTPRDNGVNVAGGWLAAKTSSYFSLCETLDELESGEFEANLLYVPASYCNYTLVTKTSSATTVEKSGFSSMKYSVTNPQYIFVKTTADSADEVTDVVIYAGYAD